VGEAEGTAVGAEVGVLGLAEAVGAGAAAVGEAVTHRPAMAVGTGTGVAALVGALTALAVALGTGSGVAQDGVVGTGLALAVGAADGLADALADGAADLLACAASVPAVAADAHPASSATPVTVPSAQVAVTRVLRVVTFICSSS